MPAAGGGYGPDPAAREARVEAVAYKVVPSGDLDVRVREVQAGKLCRGAAHFVDAEDEIATAGAGEIRPGVDASGLMRGVGNLCVGADKDPRYDARRMVEALIKEPLRSRPT